MARRLKNADRTLGGQIRAARDAAELTQAEVAELATTDQAQVSLVERDQVRPTVELLCRLADALRASWCYDGERIVFARRKK